MQVRIAIAGLVATALVLLTTPSDAQRVFGAGREFITFRTLTTQKENI